jgi:hypothetical protein
MPGIAASKRGFISDRGILCEFSSSPFIIAGLYPLSKEGNNVECISCSLNKGIQNICQAISGFEGRF